MNKEIKLFAGNNYQLGNHIINVGILGLGSSGHDIHAKNIRRAEGFRYVLDVI